MKSCKIETTSCEIWRKVLRNLDSVEVRTDKIGFNKYKVGFNYHKVGFSSDKVPRNMKRARPFMRRPFFYNAPGSFLKPVVPKAVEPSVKLFFNGIVGRMPDTLLLQPVGEELLAYKVMGKVVCVLIIFVITELRHERGGSVAQVKRNGEISCGARQTLSFGNAHVSRIAFRTCGEIDSCFGEGNSRFGPTDF